MDSWGAFEDDELPGPRACDSSPNRGASSGAELAEWVEERSARGRHGLVDVGEGHSGSRWGRRGYVPGQSRAAQQAQRGRNDQRMSERSGDGGWDSTASGSGIPAYDATRDRHTRSLVASQNFRQHSKGQSYAAEAMKAQQRRPRPRCYTNPTYAVAARAGGAAGFVSRPDGYSDSDGTTPRGNEDAWSDNRASRPPSTVGSTRRVRAGASLAVYSGSAGRKALLGLRRASGVRPRRQSAPAAAGSDAECATSGVELEAQPNSARPGCKLPQLPPPRPPLPGAPPPAAGEAPEASGGQTPTLPPMPPSSCQRAVAGDTSAEGDNDADALRRSSPNNSPRSVPPGGAPAAERKAQMCAAYAAPQRNSAAAARRPQPRRRPSRPPCKGEAAGPRRAASQPALRRSAPQITISNSTTTNNYSTINNFAPGAVAADLERLNAIAARVSQLEQDKEDLHEQLAEERMQRQSLSDRLNAEIQKKLKSTKAAAGRDREAKEAIQRLASLREENHRLRERAQKAEQRLAAAGSDQERRHLQQQLSQKELLYRELNELFQKQEAQLRRCEEELGQAPKDRTSLRQTLSAEHLRDRLAQEQKNRHTLEKKLEAALADCSRLKQELDRSTARDKKSSSKVKAVAELAAAQRERDRTAVELRERDKQLLRERHAAQAALADLKRSTAQRVAELEQSIGNAGARGEELQRRLHEAEQQVQRKGKEACEGRLAADKASSAVRDAEARATEARDELRRAESLRAELARRQHECEERERKLSADTERVRQESERERAAAADLLQQKQLQWERERTEQLRELAQARLREQELATEAHRHEEQLERLGRQLAEARGESGDVSALLCRAESAEAERDGLARQLADAQRRAARLEQERQQSQKDRIIEQLTQRVADSERRAQALRETNQQLMARLQRTEQQQQGAAAPVALRLE